MILFRRGFGGSFGFLREGKNAWFSVFSEREKQTGGAGEIKAYGH
jgi:hypothetical protein